MEVGQGLPLHHPGVELHHPAHEHWLDVRHDLGPIRTDNGIISQTQYTILVTVVIGSAVVPTLIAQTFSGPDMLLLARTGAWMHAGLYVLGGNAVGLVGVWLGASLTRLLPF